MIVRTRHWRIAKCVLKKGETAMAIILKTPCQVEEFLKQVNEVLKDEECVIINNGEWADGRENKTRNYMTEKHLKRIDVIQVLQKLQVDNYAYTQEDRNKNFEGQEVWIFGRTEYIVDEMEKLYIKLKKITLDEDYIKVMSFHPEKPPKKDDELTFPYQE